MAIHPLTMWMLKRPWLMKWMIPLSRWYGDRMGHRQLGLKYEDLLPEENEAMQLALKRLPPKEAYDRVFRIRRAFQVRPCAQQRQAYTTDAMQLSLTHQILPESEWTKFEEVCNSELYPSTRRVSLTVLQDTPYLSPLVDEIEAELKEREDLESMVVQRKK